MDMNAITDAMNEHLKNHASSRAMFGRDTVNDLAAEQRVRAACDVLDAEELVALGIAPDKPLFTVGDAVQVLTDMEGEDHEGNQHTLTTDQLASIEATVEEVRYLPNGQGWQYTVVVPVRPGETDDNGDGFVIDGYFDDSDLVEGKMPLELFRGPDKAPERKAAVRH